MGQFLENRAKEIEDAKARADDPSLPYAERAQAAQQYADLEAKWGPQGAHSRWAPIILGAASGNVMGGTGDIASFKSALVPDAAKVGSELAQSWV